MKQTSRRTKVIILGGGVAGMSAAHELIERDFDVTVYEAKALPGGKARGIPVPKSQIGKSKPLPGEHGFRFFPGFYQHLPDTLSRIPYGNGSVADNLTPTRETLIARAGDRGVFFPANLAKPDDLVNGFRSLDNLGISDDELSYFAERLLVLLTSCRQRRFAAWENQSWWAFTGADQHSEQFQKYCAQGITQSCVACQAKLMSARTGGYILLQLLFDLVRPGAQSDRVLNGPTNDVWLDPWLTHLKRRGVDYRRMCPVREICFANGRIEGVSVVDLEKGVTHSDQADYYLAALPLERIVELISKPMREADPSLDRLCEGFETKKLRTAWMNGIQYFLKKDVPLVPGHTLFIDSPWSLTSISQHQFWPDIDLKDYGDGTVHGVLSVDISNWDAPGPLGKKGIECKNVYEIDAEVRAQLRESLNRDGTTRWQDDNVVRWFLDEDIVIPNPEESPVNLEPLLVNTAGSYHFRPEATTKIPNLFLAGDYVRTNTDLATMEAANEAARRAVNGILAKSGGRRCKIWKLQEPWMLQPLVWYDRFRFWRGLRNIFEDDRPPLVRLATQASLAGWRATYRFWKLYRRLTRWVSPDSRRKERQTTD